MELRAISHADLSIMATHEVGLVILCVVIAVIASYTALDLAGRVTLTQGRGRNLWLTGGAIAKRSRQRRIASGDWQDALHSHGSGYL